MKNKMINSIPLSAVNLDIDFKGYNELARNIKRMKLLTKKQKERILDRADKEIPKEINSKARKLIEDMSYDREVYKIAEIPYHEGPPKNQKLFTTAMADYLLRNR